MLIFATIYGIMKLKWGVAEDAVNWIALYSYDKNGNILSENNTVVKTDYTYNKGGLVTNKTTTNSAGTVLQSDIYTYYLDGNVKTENGKTYNYDYNNRLSNVSEGESTTDYTFDSRGNRLTQVIGADNTSYTYDNNNRLLSRIIGNTKEEYTYDKRGHLYLKTKSYSGAEVTSPVIATAGTPAQSMIFEYDGYNRLTNISEGSDRYTYEYDTSGLRTSKTINDERIDFALDGIYVVAEVDSDNTTNYVRGVTGIIFRKTSDGVKHTM